MKFVNVQLVGLLSYLLLIPNVKCQLDWLIDHLLPSDYDRDMVPLPPSGRLFINGTIDLNKFHATDTQMAIDTDMFLCLEWKDHRLINLNNIISSDADWWPPYWDNETLTWLRFTNVDRFWLPDVYFRNALSKEMVRTMAKNKYIDIWPERKMVKWCNRMKITFICHFRLSNFPFDGQDCRFELETFKENEHKLWMQLMIIHQPKDNYQFRLHHSYNGTCEPKNLDPFTKIAIPDWTNCVYGAIRIVRHVNYYVIRYYLMTFLIMVIGFVQFWIPTIAWPGRLVFTVVQWLTLSSVSETIYSECPSNDVVSLFWWVWMVQFYDYMGLLEFGVALAWVQFAQDKQRAWKANRESPDGYYFGKDSWYGACALGITAFLHKLFGPMDFFADEHGRNKVDYCARFLFPTPC
ncbi:hypothetical protein BLOT_002298 [Blomia tropicalis]|nr:hypothetical protein BLOT_002298 [Blomia tropicalis]